MSLIVQKYGGTSVATPERIRSVADRIVRARARGHALVVVVSAMGHTTDQLIELAHSVSPNPSSREMDMLLTAGERISMALLSMALADRGVSAISFTGSQSGIITDPSHRRARILQIKCDRIKSEISAKKVVIVAGFQGVSTSREVTTLGRGGSDTTAVALAASLGASRCEIYTDVDGVFTADPSRVKAAHLHLTLGADLMTEMAVLGAGVLHPRSVELARSHGVSLWVKNSIEESSGTEIKMRKHLARANGERSMEEFEISGVVADRSRGLMTIEFERTTVMGSVWDFAATQALSVVAPQFSGSILRMWIESEAAQEWNRCLARLVIDGFVKKFQFEDFYVPVSLVGERIAQDGRALSRIFEILGEANIPVSLGSASALTVTVAVPRTSADEAVAVLHNKLVNGSKSERRV